MGDLRFIGVYNLGEFIPGAENHPELTEANGVKYISGSNDTDPKAGVDAAFDYAEVYNLLLVRYLKATLNNKVR